jgi:hypothetical protein
MTPIAAEHVKLSYWINSSGTVLNIGGPWDAWLGHDGELPDRCSEANVVGNSLFSFVENEGVRHVYRTIHARVFETGTTIEFPFRCDSAWLRREMQMSITRDEDALRYDSIIISETRRERPLPQPTPTANTLIAMCSFCKAYRFPIESPLWKDIELLFREPHLPGLFSVTHGMCQPCATLWLLEL